MFNRNIHEIFASEGLRWLGFLVAFGHMMTFLYVMPDGVFHLSNVANPQCWSYLPGCEALHVPSKMFWVFYFAFYLALTIYSLVAFYRSHSLKAYFTLLTLTVMKTVFLVIDRSFMGNYHFMHLLYSGVLLFFPQKQMSLKILVAWFYLSAGSLKLNIEWLSGAAVGGGPAFLPSLLQQWAYAYVVILELFVVWGLFARGARLRWFTFLQFFMFHAVSFYWVGYFYPSIALSMLMVFPFSWLSSSSTAAVPRPAAVLVGLLSFFQVAAFLSEKDPAIFTHRRLISMNMYDARSVCATNFQLHQKHGIVVYNPDLKAFGVRVRCDASLVLNQAKNLCKDNFQNENFISLDISMVSKRLTDLEYSEVFSLTDVCAKIDSASYPQWLQGEL